MINNRLSTVINVVGLAVGMASCSFILLWVLDEKSYDRFHPDADEVYIGLENFGNITCGLFAPKAQESLKEVKSFCRIRSVSIEYVQVEDKIVEKKEVFVTDSTFFSFFNFPIVKGSSRWLFQKPYEVVISERLANELFGGDDPIGKTINMPGSNASYKDEERTYYIVAVMKNFPSNTSLPSADLIVHWQSDPMQHYLDLWNSWGGMEFLSFLRLTKGADVQQLAKEITSLQPAASTDSFTLQPLVNLHLYTLRGEPAGIKNVWIFTWIALAIIVISCINYVNLVTAKSSKRNHEIGMKKIFGAQNATLFFQLITEAAALFVIALVVAVLLNSAFAELFNHISGKDIYVGWNNLNLWILYGLMFIVVTTLAGLYPAISISSFKLMNLLQRRFKNKTDDWFRKTLVVVQFVASTILIAATVTLQSQFTYLRRKNLGFDKENVFTCKVSPDMSQNFASVKQELLRNTAIRSVTGAINELTDITHFNFTDSWEGKEDEGSMGYHRLFVDSTFFANMSMTFVEGSGFLPGKEKQYIINEAAAKVMGMAKPVVGKWMVGDFGIRGTIVGVIKDFHFNSFYKEISPLIIFNSSDYVSTLYIHTTATDARKAVAAAEKLWKQYNPNLTFEYNFLDESFERLFRSEIRTGQLFGVFSLIAVLISCLGLFALVTFAAEAKTKEIGIRKVYGASVNDIVTMLLKEFMILVGIAMLITIPISYKWLDSLLQVFAYRIAIDWRIFALTYIITITLTLLTVVHKAIKAASANPSQSIRN